MAIKYNPKLIYFAVVFVYVILMGLFVQIVFLPYIYPQAHYGDGIFVHTDTILFHEEAKRLAQEIRDKGWQVWSLYPEPHRQVMVGITSVFYAITGIYKPYVMLPYNALLHALSVLFLVLFLENLGIKTRWAIVGSLPMAFFPSALIWTTQIHRDGLYILGFSILFWSVSQVLKEANFKKLLVAIVFQVLGIFIIYIPRPHMSIVLKYSFAILLVFSVIMVIALLLLKRRLPAVYLSFITFSFSAMMTSSVLSPKVENSFSAMMTSSVLSPKVEKVEKVEIPWIKQEFVPENIDRLFRQLAETRYNFFKYFEGAKGNIEQDFMPQKVTDFFLYLPRGIFVGFFYPLPDFWFKEGGSATGTLARAIIPPETILLWIGMILLPFALYGLRDKPALLVVLFLSAIFVYLHVVSEPNVGPIVRKRFVFTTTLLAVSISFLLSRTQLWKGAR